MLYHLFENLQQNYDIIGSGVFQYLSFRAGMAALLSLIISIIFGKKIISQLNKFQLSEKIRDLDLKGQKEKDGTPTMGGIIIIISILVPTLLFADLSNIYIQLMVLVTSIISIIGFLDDYLKIKKKNKDGLKGKFKIIGQILIGVIVSYVIITNDSIVVRDFIEPLSQEIVIDNYVDSKELLTTIPFIKDNEFSYSWITPNFMDDYTWLIYSLVVIFIIISVSNGANMTDGLDGLAAGVSAIIGITLSIFIYLSGNVIFSDYLNIMYIPRIGELVIFSFSFVGACIGFIWYNSYPAQVFMGDTGSLSIGAIIAVLAIIVKKELLIPVMCGIFLIENLSVIIQVAYFKYSKNKYGEGRRVFLMSPLHHHYQKKGIHETKIVARFWMVGILLAIITLATLKLR
ncbi:MAG: phospho-N-acetylmuramoyl-pentapeptide-transferase [Flammeovirgaceae bacterium]|jgi:phospho-N-acetylmuramoyl-pentapeptide-transferase|nr:phospho-N-acetylmuramoyl-pentapeptide-transferase [Flammeovirgaceae bacterium]|tara:strand:+ start:1152 stop:2354 length:1203 start_codon:yes stop_codon:yes gene_type:complete